MEKIVSVRAFAKQIGVSEGAVRKAIKNWSFTVGVQEDGKINSEAAMADAWVKKQQVVKPKAGVSRVKVIEKLANQATAEDRDPAGDQLADEFDQVDFEDEEAVRNIKVNATMTAAEAMRRREIIALALDKKKLQEMERILVRRDAVEKSLYLLGSELKKALLDIPARCARDIMAASTEVEAIKILTEEINQVLGTYGNLKENTL